MKQIKEKTPKSELLSAVVFHYSEKRNTSIYIIENQLKTAYKKADKEEDKIYFLLTRIAYLTSKNEPGKLIGYCHNYQKTSLEKCG